MPKQHPAQTAAGLVRRWEDCLPPHDLPKWAEDAALTMRALVAQQAAPSEETDGNGDDLPRRLMDAARRDSLTWADRHAIGQAIGRLQTAAKEIHDLNWALGTEGYDKMHDPADQAAAEEAVRGTELFIQRMALAAERQAALIADAERYQLLRRGQHWSVIDGVGEVLRADELDRRVDAARAAQAQGAVPPSGGVHG